MELFLTFLLYNNFYFVHILVLSNAMQCYVSKVKDVAENVPQSIFCTVLFDKDSPKVVFAGTYLYEQKFYFHVF